MAQGIKILLGADGMLSSDLKKRINFDYCFSRKDIDITNKSSVLKLKAFKPSVIINGAAYTDVEKAEIDKIACMNINYQGVKNLTDFCKSNDCKLIHFSSDYVFSGSNQEGYSEYDKKEPINVYGLSKSLGEDYIIDNLKNYVIIRTSFLFGENGDNFIEKIIRLAKNHNEIKVVTDQISHPTYCADLADATKEIIFDGQGIYHITNSGKASRFELAKHVIDKIGFKTIVVPCISRDYESKAIRPEFSILINTKTEKLRDFHLAVDEYLKIKGHF